MSDEETYPLKDNEAAWDRALRVLLGIGILAVGIYAPVGEGVGMAIRIFSLVPILSGVVGWCPVYAALGRATRR